jgi:hypothetical protein
MTPVHEHGEYINGSSYLRQGMTPSFAAGTPRPPLFQSGGAGMVNSTAFGNQRSGLGGVGLTSGLKVSQAPSHPSLGASARFQ